MEELEEAGTGLIQLSIKIRHLVYPGELRVVCVHDPFVCDLSIAVLKPSHANLKWII